MSPQRIRRGHADLWHKEARRSEDPRLGPVGRIKLGTESNGGFKNITIADCTFDYCRGLAWKRWTAERWKT